MEWELTDEEMRNIPYVSGIAPEQAKKLVEWGEEDCMEHRLLPIDIASHRRWECPDCRAEICRQVGLE